MWGGGKKEKRGWWRGDEEEVIVDRSGGEWKGKVCLEGCEEVWRKWTSGGEVECFWKDERWGRWVEVCLSFLSHIM